MDLVNSAIRMKMNDTSIFHQVNGIEQFRMDFDNSDKLMNFTGDMVPTSDNVWSLGSGEKRLKEVYASTGSVYLGNENFLTVANGTIRMKKIADTNKLNPLFANNREALLEYGIAITQEIDPITGKTKNYLQIINGSDAADITIDSTMVNVFKEVFTGGYTVQGKLYTAGEGDLATQNFGPGIKIKVEDMNIEQIKRIMEGPLVKAINRKRFVSAGGSGGDMDYTDTDPATYDLYTLNDVWAGDGILYDKKGQQIGVFDPNKDTYTLGAAVNPYATFGTTQTTALADIFYGTFPSNTSTKNQMILPDYLGNNVVSTTLTSSINASTTTVNVASTVGLSNDDAILVDNEFMDIDSVDSATQLTVTRGTPAATHDSGANVYIKQATSAADNFYNNWLITRTSTTTTNLDGALGGNDTDETVTVDSTAGFTIGNVIVVDSEYMVVHEVISATQLKVHRGAVNFTVYPHQPTTVASHINNATVTSADPWVESYKIIRYTGATKTATIDGLWMNTSLSGQSFQLELLSLDTTTALGTEFIPTIGTGTGFATVDQISNTIMGELPDQSTLTSVSSSNPQILLPDVPQLKAKDLIGWTVSIQDGLSTDGNDKIAGIIDTWDRKTRVATLVATPPTWASNPAATDFFNIYRAETNFNTYADATQIIQDQNPFTALGVSGHKGIIAGTVTSTADQDLYFNDNYIVTGADLDASKMFAYNWDDYFTEYAMWLSNRFGYWTKEYVKVGYTQTPTAKAYCPLTVNGSINAFKNITINQDDSENNRVMTTITNKIPDGTTVTNNLVVSGSGLTYLSTIRDNLDALSGMEGAIYCDSLTASNINTTSLTADWFYGNVDTRIAQMGEGQGTSYFGTVYAVEINAPTVTTISDRRLKNNIKTIQSPVDKILDLRGVTHGWNQNYHQDGELEKIDGLKLPEQAVNYGFIAQELEEVLPEVVVNDERGIKTVEYSKVVPLLVEGMKEQQSTIEKLSDRVDKLSELVNQLSNNSA